MRGRPFSLLGLPGVMALLAQGSAMLGTAIDLVASPQSTTHRYKRLRRRNNGFTGAELRDMRARNGVGRPPYAKRAAMKAKAA
ncbi:hypothetical protein FRZ44_38370 [Hypericibacter terrae]|uniref:Uncharacterized protein n=1 Tax=Hypericibacter terrae TaxID=2602015 RepID=A0A5J6MR58_9PROT|nr:hypothetical protein [Hypericibacter terrae]QEX18530.1 hypothetical protein FRZ44_38370 [Hypericibacter terrae]